MKSFNKIIVIFPEDSSIDFLEPIIKKIKERFPKVTISRLKHNETIIIDDDTELIIFLGHGTPSKLFKGTDAKGEKAILWNTQMGAVQLNGTSVILLSCNSNDFLKNILRNNITINSYIVFGDMPTDKEHIEHNRKNNPNFWNEYTDEHLDFYKKTITDSVAYGIEKAYSPNFFYSFSKRIKFIINKRINNVIFCSKYSKKQKLELIERLVEYKKEIQYIDAL